MPELRYEIIEKIGEISEKKGAWVKEINIIRWNDGDAKYDIRPWTAEHAKMGKGITLTEEEARNLMAILNERFQ